jgi:hypothetical protein
MIRYLSLWVEWGSCSCCRQMPLFEMASESFSTQIITKHVHILFHILFNIERERFFSFNVELNVSEMHSEMKTCFVYKFYNMKALYKYAYMRCESMHVISYTYPTCVCITHGMHT